MTLVATNAGPTVIRQLLEAFEEVAAENLYRLTLAAIFPLDSFNHLVQVKQDVFLVVHGLLKVVVTLTQAWVYRCNDVPARLTELVSLSHAVPFGMAEVADYGRLQGPHSSTVRRRV